MSSFGSGYMILVIVSSAGSCLFHDTPALVHKFFAFLACLLPPFPLLHRTLEQLVGYYWSYFLAFECQVPSIHFIDLRMTFALF